MNVPFGDAVIGLHLASALERLVPVGWFGVYPAAEWGEVQTRLLAHRTTYVAQVWPGGVSVFAATLHCEPGPFAFPTTGEALARGFRTGLTKCDRLELSSDLLKAVPATEQVQELV